jgi:3D (Asp-Asp-Asp) domain-containing protein
MVRRRLLDVEQELALARRQLEEAEEKSVEVEAFEERASGDFREVSRRFAERTREAYKRGRTGWLEVLVGSADLSDLLRRIDLLGRVLTDESRLVDEVAAKRDELSAARVNLERARTEQAAVVQHLAAARAELQGAERQRQDLADRLGQQLQAAEEAARQAEAKMSTLNEAAGAEQSPRGVVSAEVSGQPARGADPSGSAAPRRTTPSTSPPEPVVPAVGKQLRVKVTAYCLPGTTATGAPVGRGVIAVDPRVIPLGTRMLVPGYGEGIAADTGGAVKGNFIDVWLPEDEANAWGVKYLTITILG